MRFATQALAAAAVVGVAAASSSAFTAGNDGTPVVAVGQAATATSGYTVSNVDYTMNSGAAGTAVTITSVLFRLTPTDAAAEAPTEAKIRLVASGDYISACVVAAASGGSPAANAKDVTCTTSVAASAATALDIVASSR